MKINLTDLEKQLDLFNWNEKFSQQLIDYLLRTREPYKHDLQKLLKSHPYCLSFKPGINILDAGCGIGSITELMAEYSAEFIPPLKVYGCDINHDMINYCVGRLNINKYKNPPIYFCADIGSIPFPDNYFDVILLITVLQHIQKDRINDVIKEIRRVLKINGFIIILDTDWTKFKTTNDVILENYFDVMNFIRKIVPSYDVVSTYSMYMLAVGHNLHVEYDDLDELTIDKYIITRRTYILRKI